MTTAPFQADRRAHQLRKLTEVSRALTYAMSLDEVLALTVRRAADLLEAQRAVLLLTDEEGLLVVKAAFGLETSQLEGFKEPLHETLITRLKVLLGTSEEAHFLGVPLVVGGEVTGLLAVARPGDESQPDDDEWLLSALADQAAVALEKSRLDETAEFRERLIGIVSHDLRNPVSVITMASSALMRWEQLDQRTINKLVSRIHSSGQRAADMIRDLLDFTQTRLGGGIHLGRRPADLHDIVRRVVEEMEVANPERHFSVVHAGEASGEWDEDRLAQVVGNLLSNAVSYSPAESEIRITTDAGAGGSAVLVIHNEGDPIDDDVLPHLFEPMRRASADLSNTHRSVGLGLYIVKHIVEAHEGTVSVHSKAGEGTRVRVELPGHAR
ncbi:ATP-binding protein [Mitsuaria sp. 7]|uniref:GAF domain-containing sensor histidine kinase n=1 Tax=Mitsuaria sp. 7 TaxID=1658665 RepID=UPI0007DDA43F|nr:ATP-binding protein [Mitsuaria sp. 7]ANH67756.1 histidine kinase [Mitsuaria sp. 7]